MSYNTYIRSFKKKKGIKRGTLLAYISRIVLSFERKERKGGNHQISLSSTILSIHPSLFFKRSRIQQKKSDVHAHTQFTFEKKKKIFGQRLLRIFGRALKIKYDDYDEAFDKGFVVFNSLHNDRLIVS